jgi:hypothetical protein
VEDAEKKEVIATEGTEDHREFRREIQIFINMHLFTYGITYIIITLIKEAKLKDLIGRGHRYKQLPFGSQ